MWNRKGLATGSPIHGLTGYLKNKRRTLTGMRIGNTGMGDGISARELRYDRRNARERQKVYTASGLRAPEPESKKQPLTWLSKVAMSNPRTLWPDLQPASLPCASYKNRVPASGFCRQIIQQMRHILPPVIFYKPLFYRHAQLFGDLPRGDIFGAYLRCDLF